MLSRALTLATMMGFIGYCAIAPAQAQENLEAGKDAAQIYADACSVCHKSTHGLLKTVARGSLAGFLKEHYTTSPAMASLLANYLLSHGADDARFAVGPRQGGPKQGGAKQATRSEESRPTNPIERLFDSFGRRRHPVPQEATAPASQPEQAPKTDAKPGARETAAHHRRRARRAEARETAIPGAEGHETSAKPANAGGPESHKVAAKPEAVREAPKPKETSDKTPAKTGKSEAAKETPRKTPADASKSEAAREGSGTESHQNAKADEGNNPGAKPVSEAPSHSVNAESPKQDEKKSKARPPLRSGSVPPVAASHAAAAAAPVDGGQPAAAPAIVSAAAPPPPPPATTASAPPPAGKPVPPISH